MNSNRADRSAQCTICGSYKHQGETWFLIAENDWEARLTICRWDWQTATQEGPVYAVCGHRHARELIVHWMTLGGLDYPFAAAEPRLTPERNRVALPICRGEAANHIGELAVDREGVARALRENPFSLNVILDELAAILENESLKNPAGEGEDGTYFASGTS